MAESTSSRTRKKPYRERTEKPKFGPGEGKVPNPARSPVSRQAVRRDVERSIPKVREQSKGRTTQERLQSEKWIKGRGKKGKTPR